MTAMDATVGSRQPLGSRQPRPWARWIPLGWTALVVAYLGATYRIANDSLYVQSVVLTAAIFAILAVSLDLVAGATGLYSLGHAGLFALGAYGTTLLNQHGWHIFLLLPVSLVGVGLVGIVLGTVSLRVSGLYFAIMTFIFTLVVTVLLSNLEFTGGLQGLPGPLFPDFPPALSGLGSSLAWCVGLILLATLVVVWSIRSSPLYPVLLAIRDAEPFAAAAGVRTSAMKVGVFGLSAALAGMAGWAFSFLGFISPGQFNWTVSVNLLVMVILGGINTRLGPLIGAAFVSAFPVVISIDPFLQEVVLGGIFILVIVLFPTGIVGVVSTLARRAGWRRPPPEAPASTTVDIAPVTQAPLADRAPGTNSDGAPGSDRDGAPGSNRDRAPGSNGAGTSSDATLGSNGGGNGSDAALVCRGISFRYPTGTKAVDDVDLVVRRGTIHGLIGPNGSGKSTLVNLISGQLRPDSGTIEVNGHLVHDAAAWSRPKRGIMRTFQTAVLVQELPATENVTIGLYSKVGHIAGRAALWPLLPGARRDQRGMRSHAASALGMTGLDRRWAGALIADLPHGVEQLTQLAAACAGQPSILVLDEPLAGLSRSEIEQVSQVLRGLQRDGVTVIVIEHQTRFVFEMCQDVTVLAAGRLVASGPAAEVRSNDRVREVYLGQ